MSASLSLVPVKRSAEEMLRNMAIHYSQPKGFVGRSICYLIMAGDTCYGSIAGGSATRFLPNREVVGSLNNGVNNIFYHVEKRGGYPVRNFTSAVLKLYRETIERDWKAKYGDDVLWHETLVEIPRSGECYKRDGWQVIGQTKGYTCKANGRKRNRLLERSSGVGYGEPSPKTRVSQIYHMTVQKVISKINKGYEKAVRKAMRDLMNIQHEETGRLQEWPVKKPIPHGWARVSEPFTP